MITAGMKVLFIAPKFFGYEQEIKRELELAGCVVDWFDDRPSSTPLVKALIRFRPELIAKYSDAYFEKIFKHADGIKYDVVFVLKGEALSVDLLKRLRIQQKQAKFLYYTYDSLRNFKDGKAKLAFFDKACSFDTLDVIHNDNVEYLPLFYTSTYQNLKDVPYLNSKPSKNNDLTFIASIHSDRYEVAQKILRNAQKTSGRVNYCFYFFYQSKWVFAIKKLIDASFRQIPFRAVSWRALSADQTAQLIASSKVIIDIHHPNQTGLTMRTIECIGAQKKIITTNASIKNHDFFNEKNILIVDRKNPIIPLFFIEQPYEPLPLDIYEKYSLRFWLKELFS